MRRMGFAALTAWALAAMATAASAGDVKTVAVMPFGNTSARADLAPLADCMPDFFIACARKPDGVAFVERAAFNRILAEQKITRAGLTDDKTCLQVGKLLGAKYIVTGGMALFDGKLKINAHLIEVETSRVIRSSEGTGPPGELTETVQPLAADLMKGLGIELKPLSPAEIDRSPEANLHFMRGLGYYYGNLKNHAIAEFMKALALDPAHARARWWNATCYYDQQEWDHAAIEYEHFLKDFPKDEFAAEAQTRLKKCKGAMPKNANEALQEKTP